MEVKTSARCFDWSFLDGQLSQALQSGNRAELVELVEPKIHGVFVTKLWQPQFCEQFVKELEHLEMQGGA
jgi:hypothetical protein